LICAMEFKCALHDRVFTLPMGREERSWRGIFLTSGEGAIVSKDSVTPFSATSLVWTPWADGMSLQIKAGSVGSHFGLTNDILANAIGHNAESSELRLLADCMVACRLDEKAWELLDCLQAFEVIGNETASQTRGSITMIEAKLRAILVTLWRNTPGPTHNIRLVGRSQRVLQHFRHAVETHFRDRWSINKYADDIGISADRLHDICTRNLDRTPKNLVQERELHEAKQMLNNTTLSVDQISAQLGFRDVAYFSRFFRSKIGQPPATYRRHQAQATVSAEKDVKIGFADWP
jgi:AraC family transcriptional activator of pobA